MIDFVFIGKEPSQAQIAATPIILAFILDTLLVHQHMPVQEAADMLSVKFPQEFRKFWVIECIHHLRKIGAISTKNERTQLPASITEPVELFIAPNILEAYEANVFKKAQHLFNPTKKRATLLKMWDISL